MHRELLGVLACPETGGKLDLEIEEERDGHVYTGTLTTLQTGKRFPIERFIPRFVPKSNYADNFGFQWNRFRQTQLDSYSGTTITAQRFWAQSGWQAEDLRGKRVLDIGCGAGRFAEIALEAGADLVALDYSGAVDACLQNHQQQLSHLDVVQGDIYHLPFKPGQFDFVYCFGVLQHTPDVKASFVALTSQLKSGGSLAVDIYRKHWSPPRQNSCRPDMILNLGAIRMKDGTVRRSIQEQDGGAVVAAGERRCRCIGERNWSVSADIGTMA